MSELVSTADLELTPRHELGLHLLRRLRAGELAGIERDQAQRHVDACATCRDRMAQLATEDAQVRVALPFATLADGVARRSAASPGRRRWVAPVSLASAALVAALIAPQLLRPTPRNGIKGGSDLQLYVGGVGEPRRVLGEPALQAGERVRLEYAAGEHRFLAVLSVDERGEVTPLYPPGGVSRPIERGGARLLPNSVAFDGSGRERLVAVFSDAPLQVTDLLAAAHADFARAGSLAKMEPLGLGAEEIDRTVLKP
jgi:hypothetical protein